MNLRETSDLNVTFAGNLKFVHVMISVLYATNKKLFFDNLVRFFQMTWYYSLADTLRFESTSQVMQHSKGAQYYHCAK